MSETEQLIWSFFQMGYLISAMSFVGTIIAIWLALRVANMTRENSESNIAHEATTSKISEEQLHYCQQRGLNPEEAVGLIVNGFCKEVLQQLPMEFAVEAQKLVGISLEGSVG